MAILLNSPRLLLVLFANLFSLCFSEVQVNHHQNNTIFPVCSLELLAFNLSMEKVLHTVNLTGSVAKNIICAPQEFSPSNDSSIFEEFVSCESNLIRVEIGFAQKIGEKVFERVRINCSDVHPLMYSLDHVLPFGGLESYFGKRILAHGQILQNISVKFPKTVPENEGLEVYSGTYRLSRESPPWNVELQLNFSSPSHNLTTEGKDMCIRIFDKRMDCTVGHSDTDLYFVNVGGNNPMETQLLRPCLNSSVENTCGNKYPGTNCVQNRYCKKISPIHPHGLVRCSSHNQTKDMEYFRDIYADIQTNVSKMWDESLLVRIEVDNIGSTLEVEYVKSNESGQEDAVNKTSCDTTTVLAVKPQSILSLYNKAHYKLECHFINYFLVEPVVWRVGWENGTQSELSVDYGENITDETKFYTNEGREPENITVKIKSSHMQFQALHGMKNISCQAWYWNSSKTATNVQEVDIRDSKLPAFYSDVENLSGKLGQKLTLACQDKNNEPPPEYRWTFQGQEISENIVVVNDNSTNYSKSELTISIASSGEVKYICTATNLNGTADKYFIVTADDGVKEMWVALGITTIVFIMSTFLILTGTYRLYLKHRSRLSKAEISEFMNGSGTAVPENDYYAHIDVRQMAYDTQYELAWEQFWISSQELGSGIHGVVYKGTMGGLPVAVKTLRDGVAKDVLKSLLDEIKIMIYLGKHDHIVDFKGACTQFLDEGRVYALVELCNLGSLEAFLHKNRNYYSPGSIVNYVNASRNNNCPETNVNYVNASRNNNCLGTNVNYVNATVLSKGHHVVDFHKFNQKDLYQWSLQIAQGMRYLEEKKIIHGDLAVRNVLMQAMDHVKITDFGLSRQLINTDVYVKQQQGLLPWRFMAIEALREFKFTSKSDVWSYGVTVWEIFTLGTLPYPGMNWTPEFMQLLEENMRLYKPKHASDNLYKILTDCWAPEPEGRPTFAELENLISNL